MPILYIVVTCLLFQLVIAPYKPAVLSFINAFSSDTEADRTTLRSIYRGYTPPTDEPATTPDPNVEETISCYKVEVPVYNTLYAHLACEELSIDCDLYFGDSTEALKKGAGQSIYSYLPGYNGQILVGAHNNRHFRNLEYVKPGQVFTLTTNYAIYKYEVYDTKVYNIKDLDVHTTKAYDFRNRDGEVLILYTCYPFTQLSAAKSERLFVYCKKISGPRVVDE